MLAWPPSFDKTINHRVDMTDAGNAQLAALARKKRRIFRSGVLRWSASNLRDYPWRRVNADPYTILVAELLLKRTTARAAARLFEVFLQKYSTVVRLAGASEAELMQDLVPVGLNTQRANAIAKLSRYIVEHEGGVVPASVQGLLRVPGLGDYSARAVLSFGHGVPAAVVDANVARILQRVFLSVMPERPRQSVLQSTAEVLLPSKAHQRFNFGLLDLGALVCRYVDPRCGECPLNSMCDFAASASPTRDAGERDASPLRKIRLAAGMSLIELAGRARVSKLTIINIEAGRTRPRQETIGKLVGVLGVSVQDFLLQRDKS